MALNKREIVGLVLIILMVIAIITLSVFLGINTHNGINYKNNVDNVYRHAYFALMENYVDIETNLAKLSVATHRNMQEKVLANISSNANLASLALSTLNTENNDLTSIFKFTNQVADYTKYLMNKLEKGDLLDDKELSTTAKMRDIAHKIGDALESVEANVANDSYSFVDSLGNDSDVFSIAIRDLNNGSIEYPALIYDGPFSDGIHDIEPRNLTGDPITKEEGVHVIEGMFEGIKDVEFVAENTNKFTSFLYNATLSSGNNATIQISETGGHILMFTCFAEAENVVVSDSEAREIGRLTLTKHGYSDMEAVYSSLSHGMYYINYAPVVDGVIYYPDIIKLKISAETGKVVGMESLNYIYNHRERDLKEDIMLESDVLAFVSPSLDIDGVRLALIPENVDKETLTYEIIGTCGSDKYYVYLDAVDGSEVKVLMEISGDGGTLLI